MASIVESPALDAAIEEFLQACGHFGRKSADAEEKGVVLEGTFPLDAEWDGIRLAEEFDLEITVWADFPCSVPEVREVSGHIPASYPHIYDDRSFCLGIYGELALALKNDPSLAGFMNGPVTSYLYTALFFARYGRYPFGDRPHGAQGILEFYKEWFCTEEPRSVFRLMEFASEREYRGHLNCPCGSGARIRNCHGAQLRTLMEKPLHKSVSKDVDLIRLQLSAKANRERLLAHLASPRALPLRR